ncbi:MAG TPA: 2-amino-4-hydroxy-6-hydroxymethyldihydropteridine diphosphokinase [Planctomycetaceae bacterium]|nr:2-amino-4-hydroxy-6-hydroxymethyldihydropteridine diphosphokinase [Planctomycetaceae bacterium]
MIAGIALGGNLGETAQIIQAVLEHLESYEAISILKVSSLYETAPMGAKAGNRFLNGAVLIETSLQPVELLDVCQGIEAGCGRTREIHWGPRTIDLDLIFCDQVVLQSERLVLPHPACWYRRFVLDPLCDVAGEYVHPVFEKTFAELRDRLLVRPLSVDLSWLGKTRQEELSSTLRTRFREDQLELIMDDECRSCVATWVLFEHECGLGVREAGGVTEQELPGVFEASMFDVVQAGLDEPKLVG